MAWSQSGKCCMLLPVMLAVVAGLIYTGYAFRIRDTIPVNSDACHSANGRCTSTSDIISAVSDSSTLPSWSTLTSLRTKRGFETVSTRGSFAKSKQRPPDEVLFEQNHVPLKKNIKILNPRPWSKLNKIKEIDEENDSNDEEYDELSSNQIESNRIDNEDQIIQIEIESENSEEKLDRPKHEINYYKEKDQELGIKQQQTADRSKVEKDKLRQEEDEKKMEKEIQERKEKELQEERKSEEEEEQRIKEKELKLHQEREDEKQRKREEMERQRKEEVEREHREQEEIRLKKEAERIIKEEEERRFKWEAENKRKKEEVRIKLEIENRRKEEEDKLLKQEVEIKRKEEEERRLKEEERRILKEKEDKRLKYEQEKRLKEEEVKRKLEEEEKRRNQENERIKLEIQEKEAKKIKEETKRKLEKVKKEERKGKEQQEKIKIFKSIENKSKEDYEREINGEINEKSVSKIENNREKRKSSNNEKLQSLKIIDSKQYINIKQEDYQNKKTSAKLKVINSADPNDFKPAIIEQNLDDTSKAQQELKKNPNVLSLAELNDMILNIPNFMPNFTAMEDIECQQHGKIFLRQLRGYKMWALQMLDSSAKIPAGLLRGNANQLGDFDQCLGILARVRVSEKIVKIQGKYCLASMDVYATHLGMKLPVNLMQSRTLIRGNMNDRGHFLPKFTTINWGICIPAACSPKDVRKSIEDALELYNMTSGIKFMVSVDNEMCYVKQKSQSYSKETIGVFYFYAMFICLVIVATVRDYLSSTQEKGNYSERIIMAFSLKRTVKLLFENTETNNSNIDCIHGLRSILTMALYILHKVVTTLGIPYANRVSLTEVANNPVSSIFRASLFYMDSFLLLSGVITAYNMAIELSNRGEIRWFCRFIVRFIRLTPTLLAVLFWYAFVMEHTGSGPQWNMIVKSNADICKENAWVNLLHVQNFFPFEEMCATHTHQLALDVQLSLVAPAIVFFLQLKPIYGVVIVFFLLQVSATLRYFATSNNNLSLVIFHGMTIKQIFKTANMTYLLPLHRATPYLFGVCLGVLLQYTGKSVRMHKIFIMIGWSVAAALGSWSLISPWHLARRDYIYNVDEATKYAVLSPIFTAIAISWTIFACFTDNGGIINKVLSNHWLQVFSRLSYAIYLSQFIVFFYNIGTARYSSEFQFYKMIDLHELIVIMSISIVLTLLFDIPMQKVKKIILESTDGLIIENENQEEAITSEKNYDTKKISENKYIEGDDESARIGGRNWNRGTFTKITKSEPRDYEENDVVEPFNSTMREQNIRRKAMVKSEAYDEWDRDRRISRSEEHSTDNGRMNRSDYKPNNVNLTEDSDNYLYSRDRYYSKNYSRSPIRDKLGFHRSSSRERDYSNKPIITISKEEDYTNSSSTLPTMSRFFDQQFSLSETDIDVLGIRKNNSNFNRRSSAELRISDDDDWDNDVRFKRNRYQQDRVHSQDHDRLPPPVVEEEVNDEWDSLKRRSSAEGKMALLKEPLRPGNMELWTVSKMQFGSSQESDDELDEEMYLQQRREYREQGPPLREEFEEEEENEDEELRRSITMERRAMSFDAGDEIPNEFILNKNSKRITVQDLSRISSDEEMLKDNNSWNNLDVKSNASGLFKRESIVKSQASEEDPEYLIPERPKLVEQEQEHPFKKAWQMQKSRSEEEGPSGFVIKEYKSPSVSLEKQNEELENNNEASKNEETTRLEDTGEPDVTFTVKLNKQPENNETNVPKSSFELQTESESEEVHTEESNSLQNVTQSEDNSATQLKILDKETYYN